MEPTELAGKRTERRRRLREQSPDVLVALPDTDGDLGRALSDLEEVLLKVVDGDDDHEQALPAPLADPPPGRLTLRCSATPCSARR